MSELATRIRKRAEAAARIRRFFAERGVLEVQTALISEYGVTDVHIENIRLRDHGFLRTSPEYAHKKLLASGAGDLFELGPVFRAGERGRLHRPEFVMLEWYRLGWSWQQLAREVTELIERLTPDCRWQIVRVPWRELVADVLPFDPLNAPLEQLRQALDDAPSGLARPELLDWLFASRIQPDFPQDQLTIVHDYPACQAALARLKPGETQWAERFEVFAGPIELANGYRELIDADEQSRRFEGDNQRRIALGREAMPIDHELIHALKTGLPDCAGVALGFERLLMVMSCAADISEVGFQD
ncbi:MAG: EF-P lysine aminoacylase GenX [Xanthomonadaceae bacterium]|nr:EF-P lysine aminoacylase GenX [Xanthomonadaceae bacterium]